MHILLCMFFTLLSFAATTDVDAPVVLLGGIISQASTEGFLMSTNESVSHIHPIKGEVSGLSCAKHGIVVATDDEIGIVDMRSNGLVPIVSPIKGVRSILQYPIRGQGTGFVLGGVFDESVVAWNGQEKDSLVVPPLQPSCVYAMTWLNAKEGEARDFYVGGCFVRSGSFVPDRKQQNDNNDNNNVNSDDNNNRISSSSSSNSDNLLNGVAMYVAPKLHNSNDGSVITIPPYWASMDQGVSNQDLDISNDITVLPQVFALASVFGYVYVGGNFSHAGSLRVNNVAKWDVTMRRWQSLGRGVNGAVRALASYDGGIYVGGHYCSRENTIVCNIGHWNPLTGWQPLGHGIKGEVYSALVVGPSLWVGGKFIQTTTKAFNLAIWKHEQWIRGDFPRNVGVIKKMALCPCDGRDKISKSSGMCEDPNVQHVHIDDFMIVAVLFVISVVGSGAVVFLIKRNNRWKRRRAGWGEVESVSTAGHVSMVSYHIVTYDEPYEI